jgi:hypothetical protein
MPFAQPFVHPVDTWRATVLRIDWPPRHSWCEFALRVPGRHFRDQPVA